MTSQVMGTAHRLLHGRWVERALARILTENGRIDVVVNDAGVGRSGAVELLPDAMLRETFETNFFGPIRMIRAVLPGMRQRRSGCILNVSSLAGRLWGKPVTSAYDASKHALGALSDGLALEVERFGIRVRVIEPGFFATGMLHNSAHVGGAGSPYERIEDAVLGFFERNVASPPTRSRWPMPSSPPRTLPTHGRCTCWSGGRPRRWWPAFTR